MSRLIPLDGANRVEVETNYGLAVYPKRRDGTIQVEDQSHAKWMRQEGLAVPASATGPVMHLPGFKCGGCGRRNYFITCGACGSEDGRRE